MSNIAIIIPSRLNAERLPNKPLKLINKKEMILHVYDAAKNSNVVGADINELSPIEGFNSYNFLVAKLAYKILSYTFKFKR